MASLEATLKEQSMFCYILSITFENIKKNRGYKLSETRNRLGRYGQYPDTIDIRYRPCRYDTYSIGYTCTRLNFKKSRILDFNNKVNALGRSIQGI